MDLQRLASTPQPLLYAAVQQSLGTVHSSNDLLLENVESILRSNDEVLSHFLHAVTLF